MNILQSIDFIVVAITILAIGILGVMVLLNNWRSVTNRTFFFLSIAIIFWSVFNYFSYQFNISILVLWLLRLVMFFAVWYAYYIFCFLYALPKEKIIFPKIFRFVLTPLTILTSILTLTPLVFYKIKEPIIAGQVAGVINGPAILLFGIVVIGLNASGIFILVKKIKSAVGIEKSQYWLIFIGMFLMLSLIIIFNFIFAAFLNNPKFIPFGAIFTFPFIMLTAYAIIKHQLFNVKVIATELLVFVIWVIILIEVLTKDSWGERILEGTILLFVIVFGMFLIRSVRKEVSRREQFELLSKDLEVANEKLKELDDLKTDFISIASHQLRTPLTAIKGYSSMILEGTYGDASVKIKSAVDKIFQSAQRLIYIVNDLLDVSRIEQGRFTLAFEDVKVANLLRDVVEELKLNAIKKGIDLSFNISDEDAEAKIKADPGKIRQVFGNLIDNAIKYTPDGWVRTSLKIQSDNVLITVEDSGAGMSRETVSNLFQKFTRAKNVAKLHTDGSGLGLYVAKQIVEAHNGKIRAESAGEGQGSRFCVELPMG